MSKSQNVSSNGKKTKFEEDYNSLKNLGLKLQDLLLESCGKKNTAQQREKARSEFFIKYQRWYSEAISLIKIVFPDRLEEFKNLYEKQLKRKEITLDNYVIEDALNGLVISRSGKIICEPVSALVKFQRQLSILLSLERVFESSLCSIRTLLEAELFDSDIMAAENLNKNGYHRAAGAMCGVVIEHHLQSICNKMNIVIKKTNPGINDLNELLKANSVYEISVFRKIQYLADIRNKCDHKKQQEPSKAEVEELINGTSWLVKNVF